MPADFAIVEVVDKQTLRPLRIYGLPVVFTFPNPMQRYVALTEQGVEESHDGKEWSLVQEAIGFSEN